MKRIMIFVGAVIAAVVLAGCSHNSEARGFYIATPYFAAGYGSFVCVKDNVQIESSESVNGDSVDTTHKFIVNRQRNGYDVELATAKQKKEY